MTISTSSERRSTSCCEQGLVGGDARLALRLAGARRHPDPLELALERPLAGGLGLLLAREALLLLLEPGGVVALPGDPVAAVELQDPAGDVVEEVAVVGHRDDGARVLLQEALEPRHRLGVEVVRRLVEEQHVGPLEEEPAERDAARLAARERARRPGRPAARGGRPSRSRACGRAPSRRPPRWRPGGAPARRGASPSRRRDIGSAKRALTVLEAAEERAGRGHALLDVAEHVLRRVEPRLLREVADPDALGRARLAEEVLVDAGHDAEERRLAGAVRPEHADLGAREEREVDPAEDLALRRHDLPKVAHGEDVLGRHGVPYDTRRGRPRWPAAAHGRRTR